MTWTDDELHLDGRCFRVTAEIDGCEWEHADRSVGIMSGGWGGVTVDSINVVELDDDGNELPSVDAETIKQLVAIVGERAANDDAFMERLSEQEQDRHDNEMCEARQWEAEY